MVIVRRICCLWSYIANFYCTVIVLICKFSNKLRKVLNQPLLGFAILCFVFLVWHTLKTFIFSIFLVYLGICAEHFAPRGIGETLKLLARAFDAAIPMRARLIRVTCRRSEDAWTKTLLLTVAFRVIFTDSPHCARWTCSPCILPLLWFTLSSINGKHHHVPPQRYRAGVYSKIQS